MEKWTVRNVKFDANNFSKQIGVSPIVARLLVNRGIYKVDEAKSFLNSDISKLYDPSLMLGVKEAVALMQESIANKEKILIVGDYDVDGVMSTCILYKALKKCGADVSYHIPDRIKEGYGINESIIKEASKDNINTIITCDNGIAAITQVELAKTLGIKVIITDHHDIPFIEDENGDREFVIPNADVVVNPKQLD